MVCRSDQVQSELLRHRAGGLAVLAELNADSRLNDFCGPIGQKSTSISIPEEPAVAVCRASDQLYHVSLPVRSMDETGAIRTASIRQYVAPSVPGSC
jgi:hypothetical protein